MTDIEAKQQRESAALKYKHEREKTLADITYPKRQTVEMRKTTKAAIAAHDLLQVYDVAETPPALADLASQFFNECVAQLNVLCPSTVQH